MNLPENFKEYKLSGTKTETLFILSDLGYNVPSVYYFTVEDWIKNESSILNNIVSKFPDSKLAVRSSTKAEDTEDFSMAGAFHSMLHVASVKEFDSYLSIQYGNYMKLPPIDQRVSHHKFKAYLLN